MINCAHDLVFFFFFSVIQCFTIIYFLSDNIYSYRTIWIYGLLMIKKEYQTYWTYRNIVIQYFSPEDTQFPYISQFKLSRNFLTTLIHICWTFIRKECYILHRQLNIFCCSVFYICNYKYMTKEVNPIYINNVS
jgi:hypothetical protein